VLQRLLEIVRATKGNPNVDTVPNDVWSRVRAALVEKGMSHREFAAALGTRGGPRRRAALTECSVGRMKEGQPSEGSRSCGPDQAAPVTVAMTVRRRPRPIRRRGP